MVTLLFACRSNSCTVFTSSPCDLRMVANEWRKVSQRSEIGRPPEGAAIILVNIGNGPRGNAEDVPPKNTEASLCRLASLPAHRGQGEFLLQFCRVTPMCQGRVSGAVSGDRKRLCRWIQSVLRRAEAAPPYKRLDLSKLVQTLLRYEDTCI